MQEFHLNISGLIGGISKEKIKQIKIPLPPLETQKKIVKYLDLAFEKIDKGVSYLKTAKEDLAKYKQSLLKSAFNGELTNSRREYWEIKTLREVLSKDKYSMKRGPFGSSLKKSFFVKFGIRVFEQYNPINQDANWKRYFISDEKFKELEAFKAGAGDLLVSCSGTLGKILELPEDVEEGIINQALLKIRLNNEIILNRYFIYLFNSPYMQVIILEKTIGTAIKNIASVKELKQIKIPLPPLETQKEIVEILDKNFEVCEKTNNFIEDSLKKAKLLKQSLLKSAFNGELV